MDDTECNQSQNQQIGHVLVISTSLVGFVLFILGCIRDSKPSQSRIIMSFLLIGSYLIMAFSEPGKTDYLQYCWLMQCSSALGLYQHHVQYCRLFPERVGMLVGVSAGLIALSTIVPQVWLYLILNYGFSRRVIFLSWAGLSSITFVLGLAIYPADNLPQDIVNMTKDQTRTTISKLLASSTSNEATDGPGAFRQILLNVKYLKSPIYFTQLLSFVFGNFTILVSINVCNDIVYEYVTNRSNSTESEKSVEEQYLALQSKFELVRGIIQVSSGPLIGLFTDFSLRLWTSYKGPQDVQKTILIYGLITSSMSLLGWSLFLTRTLWFYLTMVPLVSGFVFTYLSMGVALNFPVCCHGTLFGLMNVFGSLFNMLQGPIIRWVKAGKGLLLYQITQVAMSIVLIPCLLVVIAIGELTESSY